MTHLHVIVETNWVVDFVAPLLAQNTTARDLYERAQRGELSLHVPAIALVEARKVIAEKLRQFREGEAVRRHVARLRDDGILTVTDASLTFAALQRYEQYRAQERQQSPQRIEALRSDSSVGIFPLDDTILARSVDLAARPDVGLESFDLSILAAVLVHAERLHSQGDDVRFCTLDTDLQPWYKNDKRRDVLADTYDAAGVWVHGDFLLDYPPRP